MFVVHKHNVFLLIVYV